MSGSDKEMSAKVYSNVVDRFNEVNYSVNSSYEDCKFTWVINFTCDNGHNMNISQKTINTYFREYQRKGEAFCSKCRLHNRTAATEPEDSKRICGETIKTEETGDSKSIVSSNEIETNQDIEDDVEDKQEDLINKIKSLNDENLQNLLKTCAYIIKRYYELRKVKNITMTYKDHFSQKEYYTKMRRPFCDILADELVDQIAKKLNLEDVKDYLVKLITEMYQSQFKKMKYWISGRFLLERVTYKKIQGNKLQIFEYEEEMIHKLTTEENSIMYVGVSDMVPILEYKFNDESYVWNLNACVLRNKKFVLIEYQHKKVYEKFKDLINERIKQHKDQHNIELWLFDGENIEVTKFY